MGLFFPPQQTQLLDDGRRRGGGRATRRANRRGTGGRAVPRAGSARQDQLRPPCQRPRAQASARVPRQLLDALRDHVRLTALRRVRPWPVRRLHGAHQRQRTLSCMTFAVMAEGQEVTTIEGLVGPAGDLHPMQQAFVDQDAFQCGYCTPGQIMSAIACVKEGHAQSEADIREFYERQSLPLRRLSQHRGRRDAGPPADQGSMSHRALPL